MYFLLVSWLMYFCKGYGFCYEYDAWSSIIFIATSFLLKYERSLILSLISMKKNLKKNLCFVYLFENKMTDILKKSYLPSPKEMVWGKSYSISDTISLLWAMDGLNTWGGNRNSVSFIQTNKKCKCNSFFCK